jgi:amino acid adenylation domain-containing protein
MTALDLLTKFRNLDVNVWLEGERLRYSAATGVLTPDLHAELAAVKEEIVRFLRDTATGRHSPPALVPVKRNGVLPLSFAQQRLWFLDQLEAASSLYNLPQAVHLRGALDVAALEKSLNELVRRHESLRTCFVDNGGDPRQLILPPNPVNVVLEDLSNLDEALQRIELERRLEEEEQQPFDLATGPLLRVKLFRLAEEEHVLAATMHHIISDGWSTGVLTRELGLMYSAYTKGEPAPLTELEIQYADYALWQRKWLQGEFLEQELSYWREQLRSAPAVLELPTDRPRPPVQSHYGACETVWIDDETTRRLRALSHRHNTTLFMTVLAGFQALLSRWSGMRDIVVGTAVAGRTRAEIEGLIGFFVNTLAIRTDLSGNPSFVELIKRVTDVCLEAYAHQEVPFEKLVEELGVERDLSRTPVFQVMMTLQNIAAEQLEMTGLRVSSVERGKESAQNKTAKFDLLLALNEKGDRLEGTLEYSLDLFDCDTIRRMGRHFERVLTAVAENEECLLSELPLLNQEEKRQLLYDDNKTEEFDGAGSLAAKFEHAVERSPEAVAVTFENEAVSYQELNRRSNQLAHHLRNLGVGPEVRVGLLIERSVEMVVSILGVLKAGGAYVPLEVAAPAERLTFMLQDAGCSVLLTESKLSAQLPTWSTSVIELDTDWEKISRHSEENLNPVSDEQNAAYVIYTSGSTGRPKGVVVTHGNVLRLMAATERWFSPDSHDVWSMFHSVAFDFSVWEMWGALLYGGRLVVVPYWVSRSADAFYELLCREHVTVVNQTPSAFRQLMQAEERIIAVREQQTVKTAGPAMSNELALRLVIFGGEALEPASLRPWWEIHSDSSPQLVNMYGITETTVHVTYRPLIREDAERGRNSVIGGRLPDLQVYILDERMEPTPVGVAGEIYVGGRGLSRGYLNVAELTAERFIPHPFSAEGARLYRTGDRGRYLADGDIEYLGRLDHQVKIRGYRIETGEIEAQLSAHDAVRDVVVISRDDGDAEKRLVAYVVAQGQNGTGADNGALQVVSRGKQPASLPIADLRSYLRDRLPDYMVPSNWVLLDQLPLTPNGKVDRQALPEPGRARLDTGQSLVVPQTLIEEVLATIWKQVLRLDLIGRDDNFFWLGGHSLLATQIVSRVRESFHVDLPVRSIFESPTLVELSERIEATMRSGTGLIAPPLRRLPDNGQLLPLSYAQQRLWLVDQLTPGSNAYNIPAEMYIKADVNVGALEQALSEVVRRHEALRTTFFVSGGQPAQRISPLTTLRLALVDLRSLDENEREAEADRLRQEDALKPFDLANGPLLRATLIRVSKEQYLLLMNMHHIVSDAWSMGVMLHEMQTLYEAFSQGLSSPLPEPEIQYSDYARWQREWLQGDVLQQEVNYWKQQLDGAPTLLELDTNQPRQLTRRLASARCLVSLSEKLSTALREFSRQEGTTLFMTLMAGFHALLRRYTGQNDILVGTPIAGRSHVELEPLIGFLVNMIPIRTSFTDSLTFRDLVKQVRESSFAAYTHQDLPFDKLVEELQPKRAQGRNPIFQAILAFENAAPEMEIATVNLPVGVPVNADIKFDLEVHLSDTAEGVKGAFVYSPDLFEPTLIARMVDHFERLFEKTMGNPDKQLSALSLLDEAEYRQVVEEWNDTAVVFPDASCIHEVFEQEVEQRPNAIAVEFERENVSYQELNRRANVLAHKLRQQGVGPEVFVGVMLERSVELIVSLLAVAKAGGVYVPLNLAEPSPRVRFILKDTGIAILVTSKQIADSMPETQLTVVCVDTDEFRSAGLEPEFADNPANIVSPENLAYLMYTSGSTGTPKGACIAHRNVLGLVKSANYADLNSEEIFLQFSPVSFDASTFEIWACLLNGARLMVFPPGTPSLSEMGEFISRTQVTTLFLTTGLFHQFIDADLGSIGAVRQLLTGGDALSSTHLSKALEQIEHCQFVNCYGPTESTVMACCYRVTPDYSATSVPIGRPISNARVYITNGTQPVSVGERGELFVSGAGLGRGYHNRPDLTSEQFLPDPYGPWPGGRLYRTGDAARYLNNGLIQFLGRVDDQLKISGYRIEPGEIEVALLEHPEVTAALVLAHEDMPGDKRLLAYVVANPEKTPSNEELRSHLRERLPEYMVPALFVMIDEMPLTQHGKVDKAALPVPQHSLSRGGREYVAPRNGLQQQLVDIWEELFKLHPIGVTDSFFELGGHSLQMIMLIARVEERLGKRVTMAELFNDPTIEHLSELIGHGKENLLQSLLVPLQTQGTSLALFSPHASAGHVWCYKELVQYLGQDQPFYGVQARQPDTGLVFHTQIEAMASDYVEAIRSVQPHGPYLLGGWSMGGVIAFEMARQLQAQGEQIAMLALMDAHASDGEQPEFAWGVLLSIFAVDLGLNLQNLSASAEEILALAPMAQLRQVWKEAKLAGVVPSDMTLVEFRRVFDIFKINAKTLGSYRAEEYRGRITLFSPEQDIDQQIFSQDISYLAWKMETPNFENPLKGWDKVATEGVDLIVVPGDHFSMMQEPHIQVLAEQLRNRIQQTLGTPIN